MPRLSTVMSPTPVAGKLLPQLDAEGYLPSALLPKSSSEIFWHLGAYVQVGEVLNANTGEAALIAAEAAAYARTEATGVTIVCPANDYAMTQTVRLRGRASYKKAPTVCGVGAGVTRFTWASRPTGGTGPGAGVGFFLDGTHDAVGSYSGGGLRDLEIVLSQNGIGVRGEGLLFTELTNVHVSGGQTATTVSGQTGAAASVSVADSDGLVTVTGLTGMTEDSVARTLTISGATTGANNGTFLITHYVSATSVKAYNTAGTSDASNGALTWTEKYESTGFMFRGDSTNSRGDAVTNNQNVRMRGCLAGQGAKGFWLESCYPMYMSMCESNQNSRNDVVCGWNVTLNWTGGMWQSAHGGSPWFELPSRGGSRFINIVGPVYQEGAVASMFRLRAPTTGHVKYTISNVGAGNCTTYIDAVGVGTTFLDVTMPSMQATPTAWAKLRKISAAKFRGAFGSLADEPTKWDMDLTSRDGFSLDGQLIPYHGQICPQKSLNRLLIERGIAAEIWDPRVASKCTISGGNLQAILGLIHSTSAGPRNAGCYPTFEPANADLGGRPTWTNLAGTEGVAGYLKASISNTVLPAGSVPGMIVVYRLSSAAAAGSYRLVYWAEGSDDVYLAIGSNGSTDVAGGAEGTAATSSPNIKTTDTLAHGYVIAATSDYTNKIDKLSVNSTNTAEYQCSVDRSGVVSAGGTGNFYFGGVPGLAVSVLSIGYVALLKRGVTLGEMRQILDLIAIEWPGIERY